MMSVSGHPHGGLVCGVSSVHRVRGAGAGRTTAAVTPILALAPDDIGGMRAPQPHGIGDPILNEVYWWDVGAVPGQPGNAAIAGHVNRPDGSSATFGNLNVPRPGDQIDVVTAGGAVLTFAVTAKDTPLVYVHGGNDPTVQRIFGPSLTPNLNLLTCWGT